MDTKYAFAALAAVSLAGAGCGGGGESSSITPSTRQTIDATANIRTTTGSCRGVDFNLIAPLTVKSGQSLIMQFTATNNRDTAIDYDSSHTHNTQVIVRQNDAVIYDSSRLFYTGDIRTLAQLQPKGSLALPQMWNQTDTGGHVVSPGTYSVQVFFVPGNDFTPDAEGNSPNADAMLKYGAPPVDVVVTP